MRSIIQQHENQYLPLNSIKSIQKFTNDPSVVRDAVNIASELDIELTDSGDTLVKRHSPFNYIESVRNSRRKIMVVDGWPTGEKPSWAKSLIRSLLCNGVDSVGRGNGGDKIPVAYWRFDNPNGALNIEFATEEGAMSAWENLERAVSQPDTATDSSEHKIEIQPLIQDQQKRLYQIKIGEQFSLVARPIDMSVIVEESLLEPGSVKSERTPNRIVSSNKEQPSNTEEHSDRNRKVQDLSKRLSFFLSDIHLRHNEHVRSILQQHENQYLPINSMKSFERFIGDPSVVLDAVNIVNVASKSSQGQSPIKLITKETNSGEVLVRRTPPFDYIESLRNSHRKMMTLDGWPKSKKKPRWAKSLVHSLLCNGVASSGASEIPVAYWRFDNSNGVLKIEFESEEGAMKAWENLERAAYQLDTAIDSTHHRCEVQPLHLDEQNKSFQLQIGEFSMVARQIDISAMEYASLLEPGTNQPEGTPDEMTYDDKTANRVSPIRQEPITIEIPADATAPGKPYKTWEAKETPSLPQFTHAMDQMYQEHIELPPPPREWLHEYSRKVRQHHRNVVDSELQQQLLEKGGDLCVDVAKLVSCVKSSIDKGKIRALGPKDGYAMSDSLGRAMLIYSESPSALGGRSNPKRKSDATYDDSDELSGMAAVSPYEACLDVFDILRSLNLDIHPSHFSYAIRAACHESRWEEAASLFLGQIEGDDAGNLGFMATGGFVPIDPALGWDQPLEIGLCAVARDIWHKLKNAEEGADRNETSPSKRVFDTAMKMCMISPSGQGNYILAAGLALGRAGLWSDCLDFASDSNSITTYGPRFQTHGILLFHKNAPKSIAAASMLACIECSRHAEALYAYDFFMAGNQSAASEWQWAGGNTTAVKPLCRDLALHAMGSARKGNFSGDAMQMFGEIIDEDSPLSTNALLGLAHSLEVDGDWLSSIQLLKGFIDSVYRKSNPKWRIVHHALDLNKSDSVNNNATLSQSEQDHLLASILASTMRVCNHEGQYGLAILLCSIANNSYTNEQHNEDHDWVECKDLGSVKAILSQNMVAERQQILEVYAQSLNGLGCGRILNGVLNNSQNGKHISVVMPRGLKRRGKDPESWTHAFAAMDRVLRAMDAIRLEGSNISPESRLLFERGLGRAMDHLLDSKQPAAALHLFNHASSIVAKKDSSFAGRVKSFFGMENRSDQKKSSMTIFHYDNELDLKSLRLSDSVLAAIIKAYNKMGQPEKAHSAFQDGTLLLDDSTRMPQSANNTLEALLDIDIEECLSFLDEMDIKCVDPTTFLAIARHYARNEIWPEVGEVYNRARRAGCISEELGLITMQAVCESELIEGKIVVLRNILEDISSLVGMKSDDWINSKYWGIKRYVGFHYARLLMKWNDPASSQKEELLFAINEMRQCAKEGIAAKNAPLECIARIAVVYGTGGKVDSALSENQRRSAVSLILEACVEANRSGLMRKYNFTAEVVRSLRSLKANKECIQVVRSLIAPGKKCRHRVAMEEGMYAALEIRDHDSLHLITDVFEKSGYDSKRLTIDN
ncbi:hypothetical protein ACHAXR_011195 [Thalassiosira sp. AJA248-18]